MSWNTDEQDTEVLVAILRYRLQGRSYGEIDRLLFPDVSRPKHSHAGWPSWTLSKQLHARLDKLLPGPDEEPLGDAP